MGGPAMKRSDENDEDSVKVAMEVNAIYHDRDKKDYPSVISNEYQIEMYAGEADALRKVMRTVYDVRVNFAKAKAKKEDWRSIQGANSEKPPAHMLQQVWVEKKAIKPKEPKA